MRILFAWLSAVHIIIRGPWNRFGGLGGEENIVGLNIYSKNSVSLTRLYGKSKSGATLAMML